MFNDNIMFHSDRDYPTIINSGSTSYSKGASPTTVTIGTISSTDDYLVIRETGGYRTIIYPDDDFSTVYTVGTTLYVFLGSYTSESGTLYWRIYGS